MRVYTSYFSNLKNIPENIVPISIALKSPKFYNGLEYKELAPKGTFFYRWKYGTEGYEEYFQNNDYYVEMYNRNLSCMNIRKVLSDLYRLSRGRDVVLLCWESPEKFCHRHLVSKWFNSNDIGSFELPNKFIDIMEEIKL